MWDAYSKDFKGFPEKEEKRRKQIIRQIKAGTTHPSVLDEHDKRVMKEHEQAHWGQD